MRLTIALLTVISLISSTLTERQKSPVPSAGCGKDTKLATGTVIHDHEPIKGKNGLTPERRWTVSVPFAYDKNTPAPLHLYIHGQDDEFPNSLHHTIGMAKGVINVQGKAAKDNSDVSPGFGKNIPAWNPGLFDQGAEMADKTCFKGTKSVQYDSCKTLGQKSRCQWATCHDDVTFLKTIVDKYSNELCVDLSQIWVSGNSNGGMMTHYLVAQHPEMFSKVVTIYGFPLIGFDIVPDKVADIDWMHLQDREDKTIPYRGVSEDGWIYTGLETFMERWGRLKNCKHDIGFKYRWTPWSGGNRNITCGDKTGCIGSELWLCWFNGVHGDWPKNLEWITYWFFTKDA